MASQVSSLRIGGYTLFIGSEVRVKDNKMYTAVNGTVANTVNMLSQCVMEVTALYEGADAYNPIKLKWKSGPSGSYNGGGFIKTSQVVSGSGTPNNFILRYNPNGGEGHMTDKTCTYGADNKIDRCAYTMAGHRFLGWRAYRDSDGKWRGSNSAGIDGWYPQNEIATYYLYGDGSTMRTTAPHGTVYLYAQWQANTYTITYKANGGSGADQTQSVTYGKNFTSKPANTFSRTGHTFLHWLVNDNSKDTWAAGATAVYGWPNDISLYAAWRINNYSVTVNPNGGIWKGQSGTVSTVHAYGSIFDLPNPTREGHIFAEWTQSGEGTISGTELTVGAGNVTLTAVWSRIVHTVTFDAGDGTSSEKSRRVNHGDKLGALPTATKKFYKLVGWFTAPTGGTQVTANQIITGDVTYYARYNIDATLHEYRDGKWVPMALFEHTGGQDKKMFAFERHDGNWKGGRA